MHVRIKRAAVIAGTAAVVLGSAAGVASASGAPVLAWSAPGVSAGAFSYGTVAGGSTTPHTFTLTNTGGSASAALTVTIAGTAFGLQADTCTGTSLGPRKSCTVTVAYRPGTAGGTDTGTLTAAGIKAGATASLQLTGTVPDTVTMTSPGDQASRVGETVNMQLTATDSASEQTLKWSATGLPAGLSIDSAKGVITGSPTTVGSSSVTVTATDGTGASGSASFTWAVSAAVARVTVGASVTGGTMDNIDILDFTITDGNLCLFAASCSFSASSGDSIEVSLISGDDEHSEAGSPFNYTCPGSDSKAATFDGRFEYTGGCGHVTVTSAYSVTAAFGT